MPVHDYKRFDHEHAGFNRPVLYRGAGPGIVVMHELFGATAEHFRLCDRLVCEGFTVFVPVLFGEPGTRPNVSSALGRCIARDFRCLAASESSPITAWLRDLCRVVPTRYCDPPPIGAVGMCLTGGFVLSMMIEPQVSAPVVCQPALPLVTPWKLRVEGNRRAALGVSDKDLRAAKQRHEDGVGLLGLRYKTDPICPGERMRRLQHEFPRMKYIELEADEPKHSTLTYHFSQRAYDELVAFLKANVGPNGALRC